MINNLRHEIRHYLSGNEQLRAANPLWAIAYKLGAGKVPSAGTAAGELAKKQEESTLINYAKQVGIYLEHLPLDAYLTEGAEQKVFLAPDGLHVWKANTSVFYATWGDYFLNILLHNYYFPATAYQLLGLAHIGGNLCAVVSQRFVLATAQTNLGHVASFLMANGFVKKRNNDYFHPAGLILEDLHDENVLTANGVLFFIDTVFYLTEDFFI